MAQSCGTHLSYVCVCVCGVDDLLSGPDPQSLDFGSGTGSHIKLDLGLGTQSC